MRGVFFAKKLDFLSKTGIILQTQYKIHINSKLSWQEETKNQRRLFAQLM